MEDYKLKTRSSVSQTGNYSDSLEKTESAAKELVSRVTDDEKGPSWSGLTNKVKRIFGKAVPTGKAETEEEFSDKVPYLDLRVASGDPDKMSDKDKATASMDSYKKKGQYLDAARAAKEAGLPEEAMHLYRKEVARLEKKANSPFDADYSDFRAAVVAKEAGLYEKAITNYEKVGDHSNADYLREKIANVSDKKAIATGEYAAATTLAQHSGSKDEVQKRAFGPAKETTVSHDEGTNSAELYTKAVHDGIGKEKNHIG